MEVKDWTATGNDSFTTPGGPFRFVPEGEARSYEYDRTAGPRGQTPVAAAAREAASPFARTSETVRPGYSQADPQFRDGPAIVVEHNGETQTVVPLQTTPGGPQIYTIQLPPAPRQPAPKRQSLWWVPLLVIAALGLGLVLGVIAYPYLNGIREPAATQALPGSSGETAAARVYRENVDTVVSVTAASSSAGSAGTTTVGTGFVISPDGFILTNAHVVRSGESVTVTLSDGRQLPARVVAAEETTSDIALLHVEAAGLHTVSLGDSAAAQVGDAVFTIGNPMGELSNSLSTGYLSAGPRQINTGSTTLTMLQLNTAVNRGNSGGPLFDDAGRVIGVVTAKLSGEADSALEGLGFALPINDVMALVQPWLDGQENG